MAEPWTGQQTLGFVVAWGDHLLSDPQFPICKTKGPES